jgi:hypothetical protein
MAGAGKRFDNPSKAAAMKMVPWLKLAGLAALLMHALVQPVQARLWYCCAASQSLHPADGSSWSRAYHGLPPGQELQPGDSIFIAGGNYERDWVVTGSGKRNKPISLLRATSLAHGSSKGWKQHFDDTIHLVERSISLSGTGIIIDGRSRGGITIQVKAADQAAGIIASSPLHGVMIRNIAIGGPGVKDTHNTRAIDLTPSMGRSSALMIDSCDLYAISNGLYTLHIDSITVQHCTFNAIENAGKIHENVWYSQSCNFARFRWNSVAHSVGEGVFLRSAQYDWLIYANTFFNSGYGVATKNGFAHHNIKVINNTFINVDRPVAFKDSLDKAEVINNIFYPSSKGIIYPSGVHHDYNWYGGSQAEGEVHGRAGSSETPFVSIHQNDFQLQQGSSAIDAGCAIAGYTFLCKSGMRRGDAGPWDMGAFEFKTQTRVPQPSDTSIREDSWSTFR